MLGWEIAPLQKGGLGTACFFITKYLSSLGVKISFVLPRKFNISFDFMDLIFCSEEKRPKKSNYYMDDFLYTYFSLKVFNGELYSNSLFEEVENYSKAAKKLAKLDFDVIHCHDWLTIKAGLVIKKLTGKPLVFHVHATEFDRTGLNYGSSYVHKLEELGLKEADAIIVVSNYTKDLIVKKYGVDPSKVFVVHNAIEEQDFFESFEEIKKHYKIVLFLGRLTLQKGPDYFLRVAKRVSEFRDDVVFVVAGSGEMEKQLIEMAVSLGIADKVIFTGFLSNEEVKKMYSIADVYVMPSVSEPFGISALEALASSTPIVISKQSGVSEVIKHCLKADFWDVDRFAEYVLHLLENEVLHKEVLSNAKKELSSLKWEKSARKIKEVYEYLLREKNG